MTMRTFAVASALFLGMAGLGAGENPVLDLWGEATAIVSGVELVDLPERREQDPATTSVGERLVEGHTVFAVIDVKTRPVNETEEFVEIEGVVHCEDRVSIRTERLFGVVPVPTGIDQAQLHCYVGQRVIVTPDPFTGDPGSLADLPALGASAARPTGVVLPVTAPDGQSTYAEEMSFEHAGRTYFAWAVPVLAPYENERGDVKNFRLPMPAERLRHNDVHDYCVLLEDA